VDADFGRCRIRLDSQRADSYSIWFGYQWSMTAKYLLDALIYALVVAATFAWLWPDLS